MAYVSGSDIKSHLGITSTSFDTFFSNVADGLSEKADAWSLRDYRLNGSGFDTHSVNQVFFIAGDDGVLLRSWPVQSITTLQHGGVDLAANRYEVDQMSGWVQFIDDANLRLPLWGRIDATFVAGFNNTPEAVKLFIYRGASYILQRHMREGVAADLLGDTQVTFRGAQSPDDSELKALFEETMGHLKLDIIQADTGVVH